MAPRPVARGFTLVELMVTLSVMVLLILAAAPSLSAWVNNTRVRSAAETLQNALRQAQAEAVRSNRTMVFFLTNGQPSALLAADAAGLNWGIRSTPLLTDDTTALVLGGRLTDTAGGVTISNGPAVVCFSPAGNQVARTAADGSSANCTVADQSFLLARTGADRPLRVTVSVGGRVRMCDPEPTRTNQPDGC